MLVFTSPQKVVYFKILFRTIKITENYEINYESQTRLNGVFVLAIHKKNAAKTDITKLVSSSAKQRQDRIFLKPEPINVF